MERKGKVFEQLLFRSITIEVETILTFSVLFLKKSIGKVTNQPIRSLGFVIIQTTRIQNRTKARKLAHALFPAAKVINFIFLAITCKLVNMIENESYVAEIEYEGQTFPKAYNTTNSYGWFKFSLPVL